VTNAPEEAVSSADQDFVKLGCWMKVDGCWVYILLKSGCWMGDEAEEVSIADQDRPRAAVEEVSYAANPADTDTAPIMRAIIFKCVSFQPN